MCFPRHATESKKPRTVAAGAQNMQIKSGEALELKSVHKEQLRISQMLLVVRAVGNGARANQ